MMRLKIYEAAFVLVVNLYSVEYYLELVMLIVMNVKLSIKRVGNEARLQSVAFFANYVHLISRFVYFYLISWYY